MTVDDIVRKHHLRIVGHGEPALIFAHGFGSDQTVWRSQVEALAAEHRIILFDHMGCGTGDISDYDPRQYDALERYADDIVRIIDRLQLRAPVFIGHSAGALIGILAHFARPAAFSRLVLIGASPRYRNDGDYIGGFTQDDLNTLYTVMAEDYFGWANGFGSLVMANTDRPELGREFAALLCRMRPDVAQSVARVIFEADYRERLADIQAPALLLQCTNDPIVPRHVAHYMAARIPQSELRILNAQGHLPHISAPAEVTQAIRDFLAH